MKKKNFIVLYCEDWHTPLKTSKHHFLERLAKNGHKILYVEMPINPISYILKPYQYLNKNNLNIFNGLREEKKNIWLLKFFILFPYHPFLRFVFDNYFINFLNQKFAKFFLKFYLKKLKFFEVEAIIYFPMIYPIIKDLNFKKIHFHIVDEWQGFSGIPKSMNYLTQNLVKVADTTVVSSKKLFLKYKNYSKNIHLLFHGTDHDLFKPISFQIKRKKNKVNVGYYGSLDKIDFKLVECISVLLPNWQFYFVGPATKNIKKLKIFNIKNIKFLGSLDRNKLPNFLNKIDVFWMPFLKNTLTQAMSPIKIYEVLGTGLPIVSVDLEGCKDINNKLILYGNNINEIKNQLIFAFENDNQDVRNLRINFVKSFSWDNRFKSFKRKINLI